ncbi:AI-2E family transporter, partial [Gemmatimonas sp.]|uniref:AI-2E family transporter n=1 Tax=Gemmatimonas sp. TaxID=1962908 RepID=UPI0037BFC5D9
MTNNDETLLPDPLPPERRGWRTADLTRAALTVLAVWFGLQLLWSVRSLAILVFLATLFGVAVARGVDYLERFRLRRGIASALIVLGTLGAIGGVLALTAPTLVEQGRQLQQEFPAAVTKVQTWIDNKRGGLLGSLISTAAGTGTGTGTTVDSLAAVAPPGGAPMVGVAGPAGATTGGSVAPTTGAGAPAAANASGPAATESPTDAIKRR